MLDLKLTQIALKMKNLVLLDLSFPKSNFTEFKQAYENRYWHLPCRRESVLGIAAGLSSMGKLVLIYGDDLEHCLLPDSTLNVKLLKEDENGSWEQLTGGLAVFGPAVLLIPDAL